METTEEEPEREAEHKEVKHKEVELQGARHKVADVPVVIEITDRYVIVAPKGEKEGKKKYCVIM